MAMQTFDAMFSLSPSVDLDSDDEGCSLGYKMALYPQFKGINSQVVEQKNSRLAHIKPQLLYMTQRIFYSMLSCSSHITTKAEEHH